MAEQVRVDMPVFLHDGDIAFGSVHDVKPDSIEVHIENSAISRSRAAPCGMWHFNKVILDGSKLSKDVRRRHRPRPRRRGRRRPRTDERLGPLQVRRRRHAAGRCRRRRRAFFLPAPTQLHQRRANIADTGHAVGMARAQWRRH